MLDVLEQFFADKNARLPRRQPAHAVDPGGDVPGQPQVAAPRVGAHRAAGDLGAAAAGAAGGDAGVRGRSPGWAAGPGPRCTASASAPPSPACCRTSTCRWWRSRTSTRSTSPRACCWRPSWSPGSSRTSASAWRCAGWCRCTGTGDVGEDGGQGAPGADAGGGAGGRTRAAGAGAGEAGAGRGPAGRGRRRRRWSSGCAPTTWRRCRPRRPRPRRSTLSGLMGGLEEAPAARGVARRGPPDLPVRPARPAPGAHELPARLVQGAAHPGGGRARADRHLPGLRHPLRDPGPHAGQLRARLPGGAGRGPC